MAPSVRITEQQASELRGQLEAWVKRVCPRWLNAQRDDLVQTALLRVVEIVERGEAPDGFGSSYLWRVAYSVTIDEIRRVSRRREVPDDDPAVAALPAGAASNPERSRERTELSVAIRDCLEGLIEPRRIAAALHLFGHTQHEVGDAMRIDDKKANNLIYRGLADLRDCLGRKGVAP